MDVKKENNIGTENLDTESTLLDILQSRYDDSARMILDEIKKILPAVELVGQWSVDVMQNGNDFYIIDMALAENSALNDCVPRNKLRAYPQQWLPMN